MKLSGDLQNDKDFGSKVVLPGTALEMLRGLILTFEIPHTELESIVIQELGRICSYNKRFWKCILVV
jgi:hypothetical protein